MIKFTITKNPALPRQATSWEFKCPMCPYRIGPNLRKNVVKTETILHLDGEHRIYLDHLQLRIKKRRKQKEMTCTTTKSR